MDSKVAIDVGIRLIRNAASETIEELRSQYRISYYPTSSQIKPVRLTAANANLKVHARPAILKK